MGSGIEKDLTFTYRIWRLRIFIITWMAYAGFYLTRKGFSVAKIILAEPDGMGATKEELALVDGAYLTAYAVGQFIWGMSGDRFGTRIVILTGMLVSVLAAVAMGASSSIAPLLPALSWLDLSRPIVVLGVLFCIQGLCQSTGWAPLSKNVGQFYSQPERGIVMGFWSTNYALGGFIASALAGWAADMWGWRYAFWVPAGILAVVWLLFVLLQRNRPEDVGLPPIEQHQGIEPDEGPEAAAHAPGSWHHVHRVLRTPMVWLLAIVYFLIKPTRYLVLFWSPTYINEKLGSGAAESGILGSMFDIAGPLAVLFGGFMSDKVFRSKRMPMSVIALVGVAILVACFQWLPPTRLALGLGFFGIGFLLYIPDSLVSATAPIDFGGKEGASTAAGIINGCGSIGAIAGGTLPGWITAFVGEDADIWGPMFTGLAVALALAAALLLPHWNRLPDSAKTKAD
jgi:OPA family sugar phosphate sensor protein UhpC-like MFS transporter